MLKNLFKKKQAKELIKKYEVDVALKLMFEIAIIDGKLDQKELELIKSRVYIIDPDEKKVSSTIKEVIDESENSISIYSTIKKINETHSTDEKKDLLKILWNLVTVDKVIDPYEENLYFKIAELIKIKRSSANKIKQENS
jgi:uncharacterized tellurite resistance protein B-like protein